MSKLIVFLFAVALSSCVDESAPTDCGPAPLAPGMAAAFTGDTATMSRADYIAIVAWRETVTAYLECTESP